MPIVGRALPTAVSLASGRTSSNRQLLRTASYWTPPETVRPNRLATQRLLHRVVVLLPDAADRAPAAGAPSGGYPVRLPWQIVRPAVAESAKPPQPDLPGRRKAPTSTRPAGTG